ncbi:B12-binding domain-containing radical SAM protein [Chloroflexi bacterium TSY]|nr:B12-binding domain-containing radical SAM protein [Chloroflexi bacterium TSY]
MRRHKVVLYNPAAVFYTMPLALIAIGSMLDPQKYDVRIIDGRLEDDPMSTLLQETQDALCLGVTVLTGAPIHDALRASRAVKARYPDLPVIWGGWHPSLFPTETLAEPSVDITVQGQGEQTFRALIEQLAENGWPVAANSRDDWQVAGTAIRIGNEIVPHLPRVMGPMNEFAPHNYALIDVERYFKLKGERQLDYISSTGCHFRCAFCADPFVFKRRWTALAPERMGQEIQELWQRHRFDDLSFQDETFFTHRDRVAEIAEEFVTRDLQFSWTGTLRADQGVRLTDDVMKLCVRSGLRRVMIGVESGSQEMMDWMQKDVTVEQVLASAELCVRHGLGAIFPFIVGFPGESAESVQATLTLTKHLRAMSPQFETPIFYFKPYPGSRITQDVVDMGYRLPETLEEWADFDYIGSAGPWVNEEKYHHIERFKFYNRFAGGPETWFRRPLQTIARWRCRRDFYRMPLEKLVVERLKPQPRLS